MAHEARLSQDRYWEILMQYKHASSQVESLIDDPKFFLAPDGKTNPDAELDATIESFFENEKEDEEHPRCRFIARYAWLKERLNIDESKLTPVYCTKLNEAFSNLNFKSATLVFPAAHGNGPASMFGHTLIRIDSNYQSDLLSYAVNYAALAEDSNGFVYAFKGIFGFYKGYYSILPYYEKVKEYNHIEHRDIWEYHLNLTQEEVRRMVMHIWELKDIYSDYYFFDENCSFDLMFLLEAARPSLRLTDSFWGKSRFWVIPSDTVRVIWESGLIDNVKYRPSQATRILSIASHMKITQQDMALDIVNKKIPPQTVLEMELAPEEKMAVLDLTTELLQYRFSRKHIEKEEYLKQFIPTLRARSAFGSAASGSYDIPAPVPPEKGHLPGKIGFGAGYHADSYFAEIGWRAAYHDLLDPDAGYIEGSQINFFDIKSRYYFRDEQLRLESLHVIDIVSLSPRDRFFKPVSWKVNFGLDRELMPDHSEPLIFRVNSGGGGAYKSSSLGITYIMFEGDFILSNEFEDRYSFGIGASAGMLKNMTDAWKLSLSVKEIFYKLGEEHRSVKASLAQNFRLTANNSLTLSVSRKKTFDQYQSEASLIWNFYM